jgi:hypothetical protein
MDIVGCHFVDLALSLGITIWVAHTLQKSGRLFLDDAFHGNEAMVESVKHLLVVGFYLINIGYMTLALSSDSLLVNLRQSIEPVSDQLGLVLVVLGVMHFGNLSMFSRMRNKAKIMAPPLQQPWPQR